MTSVVKHTTAGPFHERVLAQVPDESMIQKRRGARVNPSSLAQMFYNDKRSWMELRLWIAANFYKKSVFVTTTYLDKFLPPDKDSAEKGPWRRYIRALQKGRKRRKEENPKYIYCTEGYHGKAESDWMECDGDLEDKRIHHHAIFDINCPEDLEELRACWTGGGYVRIEPFDVRYCTALAKYMTKEAREFGRGRPGERSWKRSMNTIKYEVEYKTIDEEGINLTPPSGAVDYEAFHEKNPHGFSDYIGDRYFIFGKSPHPIYSYNKGPRRKKPPAI